MEGIALTGGVFSGRPGHTAAARRAVDFPYQHRQFLVTANLKAATIMQLLEEKPILNLHELLLSPSLPGMFSAARYGVSLVYTPLGQEACTGNGKLET